VGKDDSIFIVTDAMKKAAFLDRDGVINDDVGHLDSVQGLRLLPSAAAAIRRLNEKGYCVIVVTNQGGVAKGFITPRALEEIHDEIRIRLAKDGAQIDAIYYCPHHPEGVIPEYTSVCGCRKPGTDMIARGAAEFDIDFADSFLVGDKSTDILAGKRMGLRTVLIQGSADRAAEERTPEDEAAPDFIARDLAEAITYFL